MTDALSDMGAPVFTCKILSFTCPDLQNIVLGTVQRGLRQTTNADTNERDFDDAAKTDDDDERRRRTTTTDDDDND